MMDGSSGERPVRETATPVWRTVHTALVLDARRAGEMRVLVMPARRVTPVTPAWAAKLVRDKSEGAEAEAWELPWWTVEEKRDHEDVAHLTAEAREPLG